MSNELAYRIRKSLPILCIEQSDMKRRMDEAIRESEDSWKLVSVPFPPKVPLQPKLEFTVTSIGKVTHISLVVADGVSYDIRPIMMPAVYGVKESELTPSYIEATRSKLINSTKVSVQSNVFRMDRMIVEVLGYARVDDLFDATWDAILNVCKLDIDVNLPTILCAFYTTTDRSKMTKVMDEGCTVVSCPLPNTCHN